MITGGGKSGVRSGNGKCSFLCNLSLFLWIDAILFLPDWEINAFGFLSFAAWGEGSNFFFSFFNSAFFFFISFPFFVWCFLCWTS